jgi:hypothetical protein
LDVQSHQRNNKYVYSVNRKHTRGMHTINKINIQRQKEDSIVNNHMIGKEDIHGREHEGYNYLSDKSPICPTDVESSIYNHDDCEEPPTQTLSHLTPEKPKSSHSRSLRVNSNSSQIAALFPCAFPVLLTL